MGIRFIAARALLAPSLLSSSLILACSTADPVDPAESADAQSTGDDAAGGKDAVTSSPDAAFDSATDARATTTDASGLGDSAIEPEGIYASPSGGGTACTLSAPCTLTAAIAAARAQAPSATGDTAVHLRGGTYRLTAPITLGVEDSGQNGHTIAYRAYPGEAPVISGAVQLNGFTRFDAAKNIWRAALPPGLGAAPVRQLFVDGVRAIRARSGASPTGVVATSTGFTTTDPTYATFRNASAIEVAMDHDWKHVRCPLSSVGPNGTGGSTLTVSPSCWNGNYLNVPGPNFPWNGISNPPLALTSISWVENAYELLASPGHFYRDPSDGYVYYIPRDGEDLTKAAVEIPILEALLVLDGSPHHIAPVNDDDVAAVYTGNWQRFTGRPFGDLHDDAHATTTSGDSVTFTFTGTELEILGELDPDHGPFQVFVDGVLDKRQPYTELGTTRLAQQVIYAVAGLPPGGHAVKLMSAATNGAYTMVDGFVPIATDPSPVHDITFDGIAFEYATWNLPGTVGYIDNQAGVLWNTSGTTPTAFRIPAAVQAHRGSHISFTNDTFRHFGGTAIDLADGTQDSAIVGCTIEDTSGGGISIGEVDDYFQTNPTRMTARDHIANNAIAFVGLEFHDAVGIWGGYTRDVVIEHNDIGHTSYSGLSLGWGWGWASSCDLQSSQGNVPFCRHGSIYAGGNRIVSNYIHDVMGHLYDGGPIYTNGGQGYGDGSGRSELAGNFVTGGNDTNNMLYQDEGSSFWLTHDNVTSLGGADWIGMWTPTIHDITIGPVNYTDNPNTLNNGTTLSYAAPVLVTQGAWPPAALSIMSSAGLEPAYRAPKTVLDDDDQAIAYKGQWATQGFRGFGDIDDNVHYTTTDGDAVTLSFTGTKVAFIGEKDASQGSIDWSLDGVPMGTVDTSLASGSPRQVQQTLLESTSLAAGAHTLTLVKKGGAIHGGRCVSRAAVKRVHDDVASSLNCNSSLN